MKGPRTFAIATLVALLLLPRTGWVVRNHFDVLAGRWGSFAQTMGMTEIRDLSPLWAFRKGVIADPIAASLTESLTEGRTNEGRDAALADPRIRAEARGPLLRDAFGSIVLPERGQKRDAKSRARIAAFALRALPLAVEGERLEPDNAFYSSSRWILETVLEHPKEADAALARAARGKAYDDGAFDESRLVIDGFERQYGYRGNAFRLAKDMSILLPQYVSLGRAALNLAAQSPLTDPRRLQAMRLGETLVRTSRTSIGVIVGQGLIGRAAGKGDDRLKIGGSRANVEAFGRANPQVDVSSFIRLTKTLMDWPVETGYDAVVTSPAPLAGAALLFATIACAFLGLNRRLPMDDAFWSRAKRANWGYLAAIPAGFLDGGEHTTEQVFGALALGLVAALVARKPWGWRPTLVLGGALSVLGCAVAFGEGRSLPAWIVPGLLYVSALLLPERARWTGWALAMGLVGAGAALGSHGDLAMLPILMLLTAVAARGALPARRGMEWSAGALAALYLLTVGWNLRLDAQQGEVRAAFRTEADRFRAANGL